MAEMVFAQACTLARTMGLHQPQASSNNQPPEAVVEKSKLFRSLYVRDKNFVICQGWTSWLPAHDTDIGRSLEGHESKHAARIHLARIQDDVCRYFHVMDITDPAHCQLVARLEQKLDQWLVTYQVLKSPATTAEQVGLILSFFATRICILRGSNDVRMALQASKDAKACCIYFLLATSPQPDPRLMDALDQALDYKDRGLVSTDCMDNNANTDMAGCLQPSALISDQGDVAASTLPRLAANFPPAAAFIVARNIAQQPIISSDFSVSQPEEEIKLLETMRDRFASAAVDQDDVGDLAFRFSRTLDSLVRVVRQKRWPELLHTPSIIFNDLSSLQSTTSSRSQLGSVASRKDTPPGPEEVAFVGETITTSSMLLPYMQSLESPPDCSPWLSGGVVLPPWPESYKQQADSVGRVSKRARLTSQAEIFDITAAFAEQGTRAEEDPLAMFDFLNAGNEVAMSELEEQI